ncbi:MAG: TonB-dependent receptor [Bacteroidetes bacterium]|nr:MAG: TonB-dependent receptor [Bacteroidota bacterium]
MKFFLSALLVFFFLLSTFRTIADSEPPKKWTISGSIHDRSNGEDLTGATIYVAELNTGTVSDIYGNYSLTLPEGTYTIQYSFIGFESTKQTVVLDQNLTISVELSPSAETLREVEVTSEQANRNVVRPEMSTFQMDIKTIKKIPSLMGEVDIIKAIQLLPGVQSVSEGGSGFSVRGGAPDQNLILLDESTVYNASHLMGFFSVFNNDAIKDVKLYKGDIPPMYGGRLSSVLDVRMKEGNTKRFEVTGGIGLIASRLTVEGPIWKDRISFIVSGRRTYADLFLALSSEQALRNNKLYFYDLNAKINYRIDDNNHLFLSGYFGRDVFRNNFARMSWGNGTGTIRWNHLFNKKLFSNFTFVYSDYRYMLGTPEGNNNSFEWNSSLRDIGLKGDFSYYINTNNTFRFGISATYHMINPGVARGIGSETVYSEVMVPDNFSLETGIYAGNEQNVGERWTFRYGIRFSLFQNIGPGTIFHFDSLYNPIDSTIYPAGKFYNTYFGIEPRLGILFAIDERSSVKASYTRTNQYLQLAQNSTAGTPLDIWFPASPNVNPQVADQGAIGYFRNFRQNTIETSVEVYYKYMNHVIDFKDFAELLLNDKLEGEIREGKGWSYGAEFLVRLNEKKFGGWVSYTLSRSIRKIPEINDGNPYPAPYDKPHNIAIVANYQFLPRWSVSANWVYATGNPVTFPTGRAEIGGKVIPIYSDRNAFRYQDYHRLDLSITFSSKVKEGRKFSWDINASAYNVYNRHNTWSINFVQDNENPTITYAEKIYLFGIVPSVTFNFHF